MNRPSFGRKPDHRDATGAWHVLQEGDEDLAGHLSNTAVGFFMKMNRARGGPQPVYAVHVTPGGRADIALAMWPEDGPEVPANAPVKRQGHHTGYANRPLFAGHYQAIEGFARAMGLHFVPNRVGQVLTPQQAREPAPGEDGFFHTPADLVDRGLVFRIIRAADGHGAEMLLSDGEALHVDPDGATFFRYEWSEAMPGKGQPEDLVLADLPPAALEGAMKRVNQQVDSWLYDIVALERPDSESLSILSLRERMWHTQDKRLMVALESGDAGPFDTRREAISAALTALAGQVPDGMKSTRDLFENASLLDPRDEPEDDDVQP